LFVVRVWEWQNREKMILNIAVFVVMVWGGQYREEIKLNIIVFVMVWESNRERN